MKWTSRILALLLMVGLSLGSLWMGGGNMSRWPRDITNLAIENGAVDCENIEFEEAVRLRARLTGSLEPFAEEELRALEDELSASTGGEADYYRYSGAFAITGLEDVTGTLTTLIVVAGGEKPSIYAADPPAVELQTKKSGLHWTHMDAAAIDVYQTSVWLGAMGYVIIPGKSDYAPDNLSNTLRPVFTFSLERDTAQA